MDIAREWVGLEGEGGAPNLACVYTDNQTRGRGRLNRVWHMFPQHSLACTYIVTEGGGPHLPLLVGVAVMRALGECSKFDARCSTEEGFRLKWPNDILWNNKKIGGILVEGLPIQQSNTRTVDHAYLIGLGLNLSRPPDVEPDFEGAFLADAGVNVTARQLLETLSPCFSEVLALYKESGWPALAGEYGRHCATLGQTVTWRRESAAPLIGLARSLTDSGALELVDDAGRVHLIHSGDVVAQGTKSA